MSKEQNTEKLETMLTLLVARVQLEHHEGQSYAAIRAGLVKDGLPEMAADRIVEVAKESIESGIDLVGAGTDETEQNPPYKHHAHDSAGVSADVWIGIVCVFLGIGLTAATMGDGRMTLFWGLIAYGGYRVLKGMFSNA